MGLPEGSSSRICLPPLPPTISLRKCASVSRNASTSLLRSSTSSWMRFQPPGSGLRPSGMGWPAPPAPGSLSRRRSSPRERTAKPGGFKLYTEAEPLGVERDRRLAVINYVTHTDRGHLWSSSDLVGCCVLCTWWHGEGLGTSCESTVLACPFVWLLAFAPDGLQKGSILRAREIWSIRVPS